MLSNEGSNFFSRSISPRLQRILSAKPIWLQTTSPTHSSRDLERPVMYTRATMWIANCRSTERRT